MSRVHCLECDVPVVLDPRGICPEGHYVGAAGVRVEQVIGSQQRHPDEPEPWVYRIDESEVALVGASAATGDLGRTNGSHPAPPAVNGSGPREARPVRLTGFDPEPEEESSAESLLRELHALAADEAVAPAGNGARTAPPEDIEGAGDVEAATPPAPPPPPVTTSGTGRTPRPDPDAIAEAFAELSALDGPDPTMTSRSTTNPPRGDNGARSRNGTNGAAGHERLDQDDLATLFTTEHGTNGHAPPSTSARLNGAGPQRATDGPPPAPSPAPQPEAAGPAPSGEQHAGNGADVQNGWHPGSHDGGDGQQPDLSALIDDLSGDDGLFGPLNGAGAGPGAATGPDGSQPSDGPAVQHPHGSDGTAPAAQPADTEGEAPPPPAPDLTTFTAKGGSAARGGKRRLFGR